MTQTYHVITDKGVETSATADASLVGPILDGAQGSLLAGFVVYLYPCQKEDRFQ